MKKGICLVFSLLFLILFISCNKKEIKKLATPEVSVNDFGLASWETIENSKGYSYIINEGDLKTTTALSVILNTGDSIIVKAIGDGKEYLDSDYSEKKEYSLKIAKEKLSVPLININNDGLASWDSILNADEYNYIINDGNVVTTAENKVQLKAGDTIIVKAISNNEKYNSSEYSSPASYLGIIQLKTPLISISYDGLVSWKEVINANGYKYQIDNEEEKITNDLYIQLNDGQSIKIKSIGDGVEFKDSDYSNIQKYNLIENPIEITFSNLNTLESNFKFYKAINSSISLDDLPSISGYMLMGCYTDIDCQNEYDFDTILNEDTTLYLYWQRKYNEAVVDSLQVYIDSLINKTTSYIPSWNEEGFKGRWNYIDGVFLNSIINLYKTTNDEKYMDFVIKYINYYIDSSGNFVNPASSSGESGYRGGELDSVCASKILFDAYEYTKDNRYTNAINTTYAALMAMPLAENGYSFSHKSSYLAQIWLDGMYMYVPFYARYALMVNDSTIFDTITKQYKYIRDNMFDEEKGLYYHGHDTSKSIFWADLETGNSKSFWLRSMGWYIVSLVDVLEYFPEGSNREYLKGLLSECIDGIMKYQDEGSKLFYQLIDQGERFIYVKEKYLSNLKNEKYIVNGQYIDRFIANYLESSGSSMIAYTLLKGSRLGYLSGDYYSKGIEMYEAIYKHSFKNNSLNDICITAGLGPNSKQYRDGSLAYYLAEPVGSNDAKGVGPFIMAYLEYSNNLEN